MPSRIFHKPRPVPLTVENSSDVRIAVLISGRGTNLQALMDAERRGRLGGRIVLVVSNRADAAGPDRARAAGIETLVLPHQEHARARRTTRRWSPRFAIGA